MAPTQKDFDYVLPQGGTEVRRLNALQELITKCNGYTLHPRLHHLLKPDGGSNVAEIATGTGVFMRVLDQDTGQGAHAYVGFDISPASFPSDTPSNFSFQLLDAREDCPTEFAGSFDIVHIRLLVGGMAHGDWAKVARCAQSMLRPGGALMWTELRLRDSVPTLRSGGLEATDNGLGKLCQRFLDILGERLDAGVSTLEQVLAEVSMKDVNMDVASSDRLPELREMASVAMADASEGTIRRQADLKVPGAWDLEEVNATRKAAAEDIQSGTYTRYNLHTFTAFKA